MHLTNGSFVRSVAIQGPRLLLVRGSLHAETTPYGNWRTKSAVQSARYCRPIQIDRSDDGYGMRRSSLDRRML